MKTQIPVSHPIVDQQGRLTQVWQKWLTSELDQSSSNSVMLAALSAPVMSGSVGKELTGIGGAVSGLTPSGDSLGIAEKPRWVAEWQAIQAEYPSISSDPLAVHSTYLAAYAALQDYLDTLPTWSDLSTATAITRTTWDGKWADYYAARSALFTRLERQALDDAAAAGDAAATAQGTANGAATAADAAQTAADEANAAIADIAADGKLTPVEKQSTRLQWDTILGERAGIQSRADAVSVSRTAYDSAFQTLATYLNAGTAWSSGTPSWIADANLSTTTPIDGPTFRANWKSLFDARQALLNAIMAAAQTAANNAAAAAANAQTAANSANAAAAYADSLARSSNNLIKNGNSEDPNPTGYEAAGVYDTTYDTYKAFTGSKVRRTVTGAAGYGAIYVTGEIPCAPGDQHAIEAMVRNISAVGVTHVGIRYRGPSDITGWGTLGALGAANAWTRADCSGTAPEGTTSVSFYVQHYNAGGAGALAYYDCLYAARKVSAGMLEADILKALLIKGEVIETPNYVPGSAGVPPVGARVAGAPWTITLLDGTTIQGNLELGEGASIAGHPALSYANMLLYRKVEFAFPGAWSWTVPAGVRRARITVCGAGGGGKGGSSSGGGLGGRNGATLVLELTNLTQGQVISGANGAAGAAGGAGSYGGDGGASTLTVAGKTWTVNGGAGGGNATTSCSTLTGGYGTTCTASERKTDLLDGSLLGGLNIQSLRYATGASGALNDAARAADGGYGSWLAPGGKGGDAGTASYPFGKAGAAGTKGSGGGGGGGSADDNDGAGGIGGAGSPGYACIEY